jgi:hypothetical protein
MSPAMSVAIEEAPEQFAAFATWGRAAPSLAQGNLLRPSSLQDALSTLEQGTGGEQAAFEEVLAMGFERATVECVMHLVVRPMGSMPSARRPRTLIPNGHHSGLKIIEHSRS